MENHIDKKLTIDQVAELCGVSKTTISRYLNGKFSNISAATRERIKAVIEEYDYRPNRSAQRLKASRSMLIGCVVADVSSPFSSLLLKGMMRVCEAAGYQVLFADTGEDPERERNAIKGFLENRVDGLLVNTTGKNDEFLAEVSRQIPIALADRSISLPGVIDTVVSANRESAYNCVRYLAAQGYTRVAFFTEGNGHISPRMLRRQGYEEGVRAFCPDMEPEIYIFSREDEESCLACVQRFRRAHAEERIAILCVNGVAAQHVLLAFNALGRTPGYDYGLCTFDDWSWLRLAPPGITTVALESDKIGASAAEMVIGRLSGERADSPAECLELPTKLIPRGSTPNKIA